MDNDAAIISLLALTVISDHALRVGGLGIGGQWPDPGPGGEDIGATDFDAQHVAEGLEDEGDLRAWAVGTRGNVHYSFMGGSRLAAKHKWIFLMQSQRSLWGDLGAACRVGLC